MCKMMLIAALQNYTKSNMLTKKALSATPDTEEMLPGQALPSHQPAPLLLRDPFVPALMEEPGAGREVPTLSRAVMEHTPTCAQGFLRLPGLPLPQG